MTRLLSIATSLTLFALVSHAARATEMAPCKHELGHMRHLEARYLVGSIYRDGSIFGICRNGTLKCYEDHALADAPLSAHTQVNCSSKLIHSRRRRLGVYMPNNNNLWPNGIVYYKIGTDFTEEQKALITKAMNNVIEQSGAKIKFVDCRTSNCKNYVDIVTSKDSCDSQVGYLNIGAQRMNLAGSCFTEGPGFTMHELLHALGVQHEHTHPQRQVIVLRNTKSTTLPLAYAIDTTSKTTAYDMGSIMHYRRYDGLCVPLSTMSVSSFCDITQPEQGCIVPTEAHCDNSRDGEIGQVRGLSASDAAILRKLYGGTKSSEPQRQPSSIA